MIPVWPSSIPQFPLNDSWSGGPWDERVSFAPDRGPPIERVGSTAQTFEYSGIFPGLSDAQRAEFIRWFREDIAMGIRWFAWRDPVTSDIAVWKILSDKQAFTFASKQVGWHDLAVRMLRRSFSPWWAVYCPAGLPLRPPAIVADYTDSVFGVDLARGPASAVAAASGTFDVHTTATGGAVTVEAGKVIAPGGIPATAPVGVTKIVAYPPP